MQCLADENKIRSFYHHPFPYFLRALKLAAISIPFIFVASFFNGTLDETAMIMVYAAIGFVFALIIAHDALLYFLDRIIVTNKRIVYINWINLFTREENEANLDDIQDITTSEFGILSNLAIFDYGTFQVETAASKVAIVFDKANDPEGIKNFVYQLQRKSSSILRAAIAHSKDPQHDRTQTQNYEKTTEEAGVPYSGGKPT